MKDDAFIELKEKIVFKDWEILHENIRKYNDQIDSIKNWCIVVLTFSLGYIITHIEKENGNLEIKPHPVILLLPVFVIIFFAINELIKQIWKFEDMYMCKRVEDFLSTIDSTNYPEKVRTFIPPFCYSTLGWKLVERPMKRAAFARNFTFFYFPPLSGYSFLAAALFSFEEQRILGILMLVGTLGIFWMAFSIYLALIKEKSDSIQFLIDPKEKRKE